MFKGRELTLVLILLPVVSVSILLGTFRTQRLESRVETLETSKPSYIVAEKECLDYTLRDYRTGNAPEKCGAEVYGDQF